MDCDPRLRPWRVRLLLTLPGVTLAFLLALLLFWLTEAPAMQLSQRIPGEDDPHHLKSLIVKAKLPEGTLQTGSGIASSLTGDWPMFRGSDRDAISKSEIKLASNWPDTGPPVLWSTPLGEGYAAAAVHNGRVYIFDYNEEKKRDTLRCLSLDDGLEIWNYSYPIAIKRNHGISRTIPAVNDRYVVALGPKCHVICNDAVSGKLLWMVDLKQKYGTEEPLWYAGQCPVLDGDNVVLAPGGKDILITSIDCATGEPVWQTPNPGGWKMSHSSLMPMELDGRKTWVYAALGGVIGVDAKNGEQVWMTEDFTTHTVSPSPLPLVGKRIIVTAGYGKGGGIIDLTGSGDSITAKLVKSTRPREFGSEQQTPIEYNGYIYAVLPKPRQELVCMDRDLNEIWASGPQNTFGLGPYMIADGMIFLLDDSGLLTIAEATHEGYRQLDQDQVLQGHDCWGPMALVDGRLFVRDMQRIICLDVRANTAENTEK